MAPLLRIYGIARTRAFRVLWMAKELGLAYEHIPTEIGEAGARRSDYLAINPNGRLPAIDDNGFVLWESLAITLYLARKYSTGKLYPAAIEQEARAWQSSLWSVQEVDRGSTSGRCMRYACRLASEMRSGSPKRSKCWKRRSRCSTARSLTASIFSAMHLWLRTSTSPRSSAAPSIWIYRQRRGSQHGSSAASNGRPRARRSLCVARPTRASPSK